MKKIICLILMSLITTVYAADAHSSRSKKVQQTYIKDKFGEERDVSKILCACQFNKSRNPGKYKLFNGYVWVCDLYDSYGNCLGTSRVKPLDVNLE